MRRRPTIGLQREPWRGKPYLLFVGRFSPAKGFLCIADAIHSLLEKFPDLLFVIAGREAGGYRGRPALEHLLEKAGVHRGRVLSLGEVRHDRLYPVMRHARALVVPSLVENFPNVCLEAMALGKVVVGTRRSGLEQLIADGVSGILCDPGSSAGLLEAMERAMRLSEEQQENIGRMARERIDALRPEKTVGRLLSFYEEVIERKRRRGRRVPIRKGGTGRR